MQDRADAFLRQQTVLAKFGEMALRCDDIDVILTEACRLIGEALDTDLAKVMYLLDDCTLLVRAGVRRKPGIVGHVTVRAERARPRDTHFVPENRLLRTISNMSGNRPVSTATALLQAASVAR